MTTPREQRLIRLANDYQEMVNLRGPIVSWNVRQGQPPHVEAYELTVSILSIIGPTPRFREQHQILITLPATYPHQSAPHVAMLSRPVVFHPNWWANGGWCYGTWDVAEGLGHHVVRMLRTLQFNRDITHPGSPANQEAAAWYQTHMQHCPCDTQTLPDPTKVRFRMGPEPGPKRFQMRVEGA
jgi:ubiquitin-protein ligase